MKYLFSVEYFCFKKRRKNQSKISLRIISEDFKQSFKECCDKFYFKINIYKKALPASI